jgi:hypothetical protein
VTSSDLATFFDLRRPALARQLFTILEDTRVDAWLLRRYRGMRRAFDSLGASLAQPRSSSSSPAIALDSRRWSSSA